MKVKRILKRERYLDEVGVRIEGLGFGKKEVNGNANAKLELIEVNAPLESGETTRGVDAVVCCY